MCTVERCQLGFKGRALTGEFLKCCKTSASFQKCNQRVDDCQGRYKVEASLIRAIKIHMALNTVLPTVNVKKVMI